MKRILTVLACLLLLAGCAKDYTREIDLATDTAEDADFTSADLFRITDGMIASMQANGFLQVYRAKHGGEQPVLLLAKSLINNTDEHINTRLVLEKIRTKMINEGMSQYVDDQAFDMALEQLDMQATDLYDNAKAAKIGNFVGAKYILRGTISNIRRREERENINYMNVTLDIFEVETLLIKWTDEVEFKRASTKGRLRQ
jgi:uncharacterized protein (TIGR02722 family)